MDTLYFLECREQPCFNALLLEVLLWIAPLLAAFILPRMRPTIFARMESAVARFSRRRVMSVALVFVLGFSLRLALLPLIPVPEPAVHDEFSYLLQSNTFAQGRLTNPPHPMGVFFESFHINQWPTYQSMYHPAQAVFLVMGEKVFGNAWFGMVLTIALTCAAITWMLQAWMPSRWALLGGLFCVLRFAVFSSFVNSYFRSAAPALGGALALGALPRLRKRPRAGDAALFGLGLAILADSRPYEGLLFSIPALLAIAWWQFKGAGDWKTKIKRVVLPAAAVLAICGAATLYYNWRGTGHATLMPYQENWRQYHITRPMLWQKPQAIPEYHHIIMRKFYIFWEVSGYLLVKTWGGFREFTMEKLDTYYKGYLFPLLLISIPAVWDMLKSRRVRLLAWSGLLVLGGLMLTSWRGQMHYPAPALGAVIAVQLYALRMLRTWRPRGTEYGLMLSRAGAVMIACLLLGRLLYQVLNPYDLDLYKPRFSLDRPRLENQLKQRPGGHIIFVHYRPRHTFYEEWVYNLADIDHQKVIWARDMGADKDRELLNYYPQRTAWVVDPDDNTPQLYPYGGIEWRLAAGNGLDAPDLRHPSPFAKTAPANEGKKF